jgi:hypothetical protein
VGAVSGAVVFLEDFFVFGLDDSVLSVAVSLLGAFSVVASAAFSERFVLLFFSLELLVLFEDGLVTLSSAGLFVLVEVFVDAGDFAGAVDEGSGLVVALADGVMVAATDADAAGVMVAPTVAAGVALAVVEAALVLVVPVVVPVVAPVVVPLVEVTPTLKLGVTP